MAGDDNFSLSVFLYIFNNDRTKLLMLKRNAEKRKKWGVDWGIVGGWVEPGELSIEAGIREAEEEISVILSKDQLQFLFFEERPSKVHTPAVHFFYAVVLDEKTRISINKESDEYRWFSLSELPKSMFDEERIVRVKEIFLGA